MTIVTCKTKAELESQMLAYMRSMKHRQEIFMGVPLRGDNPAETERFAELAKEFAPIFSRIMESELCDPTVEAMFAGQLIDTPGWGCHSYQIVCYQPLTPLLVSWGDLQ